MIYHRHGHVMKSCSYIIREAQYNYCYLVDCGDFNKTTKILETYSIQPKGIFLTHCHFDHIYGINKLLSFFPECKIYGSKETLEGLYNAKINLSFYQGNPFIISSEAIVIPISSTSKIDILGEPLHIFETPGHDIGCLSYQYKNYLFTGDSYIPFAPVFTKWKRSDKEIAKQQEQKLKNYAESHNLHILCGHYQL